MPTFLNTFVDPIKFAKITGLDKFQNSSNDNTAIDVETSDNPSVNLSSQNATTRTSSIKQRWNSTVKEVKIGGKNLILKRPKSNGFTQIHPMFQT